MRKIKYTIMFIVVFCIYSSTIKGQNFTYDSFLEKIKALSTDPSKYKFTQYGKQEISVNHFTGSLNVHIPIYIYSDNDFHIPITLGYENQGFIANKREGVIGLNWILNAGGKITRQVEGIPDETHYIPLQTQIAGVLADLDTPSSNYNYSETFNKKISNDNISELANGTTGTYSIVAHKKAKTGRLSIGELSPDIFYCNMNGNTFQFNSSWEKSIQISGNKKYKVTFNNYFTNSSLSESQQINITDEKGYQFIFGGNTNAIQKIIIFDHPTSPHNGKKNEYTTEWYLTKIIAPNGRIANFTYKELKNDSRTILQRNLQTIIDRPLVDLGENRQGVKYSSVSLDKKTFSNTATKQVLLEKITIDNTSIEFNYSPKPYKFYTLQASDLYNEFNNVDYYLENIEVKYNDDLIKKIGFIQKYLWDKAKKNKRLFLYAVGENIEDSDLTQDNDISNLKGNDIYSFSYYNTNNIPDPLNQGTDHWGFFNGNNTAIPTFQIETSSSLVSILLDSDTLKMPNENLTKTGALVKMIYPTGGQANFEYELNEYFYKVMHTGFWGKEDLVSGHIDATNSLNVINEVCGGLRIKQWNLLDVNDNLLDSYAYKYIEGDIKQKKSSGILLQYPDYVQEIYSLDNGRYTGVKCYVNATGKPNQPSDGIIQYSQVLEKAANGGYTIFKYTSYLDEKYRDFHDYLKTSNHTLRPNYLYLKDNRGSSFAYTRGLLTHKIIYDKNNHMIKKENIIYDIQKSSLNNFTNAITSSYLLANKYSINNFSILPVKKTTTYFDKDNQEYKLVEKFEYNSYNHLRISTKGDEQKWKSYRYKYSYDYLLSPYKEMVDRNIISSTIEKIAEIDNQEVIRYKTSYFEDATKTKGLIVPLKVETSRTGTSGLKAEVTYDVYDSLGNLLQKTDKDGIITSFLWSYNGQYPVAEVVNASYDQVKAILGVTPESISSSLNPDMTKINPLREKLPEAQVTTYQYKPLVGLTEKTDPRGVTTYYDYDSFGRLKETYIKENGQKRIIESYNYHYQNQ